MSTDLVHELKGLIISTLDLKDLDPEQIGDQDPLFGEGLGLDSIDGLELVVSLEKNYGIRVSSSEESRAMLQSVVVLAAHIEAKQRELHQVPESPHS